MTTPTPLFFGPRGKELFGWYHPGASSARRRCAILLAPPVGHEYLYSYRAFRLLAVRLAARGFPVLRFDYYGTGNSAGEPYGPHLVSEWLASVPEAADELRRRSGCNHIAVIGLRLGATLAATSAGALGADAMVLWDPCVTGTSYTREVKLLAATADELFGKPVIDATTGTVEALGFALTPDMIRDIVSMDLRRSTTPIAPGVLVLTRPGLSSHAQLVQQLGATGVRVTRHDTTEHEAFLVTAVRSQLPADALRTIEQWLTSRYPSTSGSAVARRAVHSPTSLLLDDGVTEDTIVLHDALFGIVTTPAAGHDDATRPALIFLNTGADHHVGPRRMYVHLARTLARHGFRTLRFDLAGIGDSPPEGADDVSTAYPTHATRDIRAAISYMSGTPAEKRGAAAHGAATHSARRVVLIGMCSGGYHAAHVAHRAPEVAGVVAINPPLYWDQNAPSTMHYHASQSRPRRVAHSILSSVRSQSQWARLLRGGISPMVLHGIVRGVRGALHATGSTLRQQHADAAAVASLFPPHLDTHLIFASGDLGLLYLQNVCARPLLALTVRSNFTLSVVEGAGHVFMPLTGQARLNELIIGWLRAMYGGTVSRTVASGTLGMHH